MWTILAPFVMSLILCGVAVEIAVVGVVLWLAFELCRGFFSSSSLSKRQKIIITVPALSVIALVVLLIVYSQMAAKVWWYGE